MKSRTHVLGAMVLLSVSVGMLGLSAPAASAAPTARAVTATSGTGTFVRAYSVILNGSRLNLSPLDVQATSDGGYIALAETQSPNGLGVDWLVKLSAGGAPAVAIAANRGLARAPATLTGGTATMAATGPRPAGAHPVRSHRPSRRAPQRRGLSHDQHRPSRGHLLLGSGHPRPRSRRLGPRPIGTRDPGLMQRSGRPWEPYVPGPRLPADGQDRADRRHDARTSSPDFCCPAMAYPLIGE
jgi:hypothetical protein